MRVKTLILMLAVLLLAAPAYADKKKKACGENWRKEMRDFKLRFLAQEMELKPDQQKQFVTLYTQMSDEKEAVMRQTRTIVERVNKLENPTDADYTAASEALIRAHEQDLAIEKKYEEKFKTFLSPKQIFSLKEAERKFRDKLREMRRSRPSQSD